jgi:CHAD domain-containing protein
MKRVRKQIAREARRVRKAQRKVRSGMRDESVHDVRKQLKRMRAAVKLLKAGVGRKRADRVQKALRDAGRPLSEVRDGEVMLETLDALGADGGKRFGEFRKGLERLRRETRGKVLRHKALGPIKDDALWAVRQAERWQRSVSRWKVVAAGLRESYQKGRRALRAAERTGADGGEEAWHECRKRTKDFRYQLELVGLAAASGMAEAARKMTDALGEDHDLVVLGSIAGGALAATLSRREAAVLFARMEQRRESLQEEARRVGGQLFAERPQDFAARMEGYWKKEKAHGDAAAEGD